MASAEQELSDFQARLAQMIVNGGDQLEMLPGPLRRRVKALTKLQEDRDALLKQFVAEKRALEQKYETLYAPIYDERAQYISGAKEAERAPTDPEDSADDAKIPKGIPDFWLQAFSNSYMVESLIKEHDFDVLKHLVDVRCSRIEPTAEAPDQKGFTLTFTFSENEFFTNSQLTKKYYMVDEEDPVLDHAEGCDINWKADKDTTVVTVTKKQKSKKGNKRVVTTQEKRDSFFNFFKPPSVPSQDQLEEMEEEAEEELQQALETDYEVGAAIRDQIIPNAVRWFTGEAQDDDDEYDEDDYDEDEDDEDDDEDEDEEDMPALRRGGAAKSGGKNRKPSNDDDDDDEEEAPKPAKGGKGGAKGGAKGPAGAPGQNPDCKQQ